MYKNNDEIYEQLELLREYINLVPEDGFAVVEKIVKNKKPKPAKRRYIADYGPVAGKSHADLIKECIELLGLIRYQKTKQVFQLLSEMLRQPGTEHHEELKKALRSLCAYELRVLEQVGYLPQLTVLEEVEKWSAKKLSQNLEGVVLAAGEILDSDFESYTSEYKDHLTFTVQSGALKVSDELKEVRLRAMTILKSVYVNVTSLPSKIKVINALKHATQTPSYGEDLELMIHKDTQAIIEWYIEILPDADSQIIQDIEEQCVWFVRRFGKDKLLKLRELQEAIAEHKGYSIFRVFVGDDGRLDPNFDHNRTRQERTEKINEFVENITEENFDGWREKLVQVLKNYTDTERGEYSYFDTFLQELGKKKPNLALKILNENEKEFKPFLLSLIAGLWHSDAKTLIKEKIFGWITAEENLRVCAAICMIVGEVDVEILQRTFEAAKKAKDGLALTSLIRTLSETGSSSKELFLATIKELTKLKNTWWVNHVWHKSEGILQGLSIDEFDVILDNMVFLPSIDYHSEEVLKLVAKKEPAKLIDFLHRRVEIEARDKKKNRERGIRYDAIPYNLYELPTILGDSENVVIPKLLGWFENGGEKNRWLFEWEAGELLAKIFPDFTPALEKTLIGLVKKKTKESRRVVLTTIGKFENNSDAIWHLVRVLVNTYADNKKLYTEVMYTLFGYLAQTGVVTGEYGLRDAYKGKRDALKRFIDDKDKNFVKFVGEYEKYLERNINFEQKRTDADIEMLKREYA